MKLLACLDASTYAASVTDYAAWIADRTGGSVELLHVIQRTDGVARRKDLSGALGLGARSELMEELVATEEVASRLAREQAEALLSVAAERLEAAGVTATTLMRHGDIVETVIEREAEADLVIIGKRGASADFARGHLGSKVERVVRQSALPVLVANRDHAPVKTVLVAFDGGATSRKAVAMAATSPLFEDCTIHVASVGENASLGWAEEVVGERLGGIESLVGNVEDAITGEVERLEADMLLMGAYGHSPLRSMILGSTTTAMLRAVHKPVLLFR